MCFRCSGCSQVSQARTVDKVGENVPGVVGEGCCIASSEVERASHTAANKHRRAARSFVKVQPFFRLSDCQP